MAVKGARKIDASDIEEEFSRVPAQREQIAYKGRRVCVRAKGTQKKRERIGEDQKGSVERAKMIGTREEEEEEEG